jgi:hypothetical protein
VVIRKEAVGLQVFACVRFCVIEKMKMKKMKNIKWEIEIYIICWFKILKSTFFSFYFALFIYAG